MTTRKSKVKFCILYITGFLLGIFFLLFNQITFLAFLIFFILIPFIIYLILRIFGSTISSFSIRHPRKSAVIWFTIGLLVSSFFSPMISSYFEPVAYIFIPHPKIEIEIVKIYKAFEEKQLANTDVVFVGNIEDNFLLLCQKYLNNRFETKGELRTNSSSYTLFIKNKGNTYGDIIISGEIPYPKENISDYTISRAELNMKSSGFFNKGMYFQIDISKFQENENATISIFTDKTEEPPDIEKINVFVDGKEKNYELKKAKILYIFYDSFDMLPETIRKGLEKQNIKPENEEFYYFNKSSRKWGKLDKEDFDFIYDIYENLKT